MNVQPDGDRFVYKKYGVARLQNTAMVFFMLSLNFETWDLLGLQIDYLVIKITFVIYLLSILITPSVFFSFRKHRSFFLTIFSYFALLTVISYLNINGVSSVYFDSQFFINLVIFLLFVNHFSVRYHMVSKCFIAYAISAFLLSLFYFTGINVDTNIGGRVSILGENPNNIGINFVIACTMIFSLVFENKFKLGAWRICLLFIVPFLLVVIVQTGSRLATLSLFLIVMAYIVLWNSKNLGYKLLFIFSGALVMGLLFLYFSANSIIADRLSSSINSGEIGNRDLLWAKIIPLILDNLFWGVGITGYAGKQMSVFDSFASPHNGIIESLCYTGIIGTSILLLFLVRIFRKAVRRRFVRGEIVYMAFCISILGVLLSAQIFQQKIIWILCAFILAEPYSENNGQPAEIQTPETNPTGNLNTANT